MDAETSKAVHACTGCGRCTSFCKHENAVGSALFAARQVSVDSGTQPRGAASTMATFAQAQNPFGRELNVLVGQWRADAPVRSQLFTGCTALVKRAELIEDILFVSAAFGTPMGVSRASARCCGYPLFAAGAVDQFREHARGVAKALAAWPELVVLDPGCAYTFAVAYPQVGVSLGTRVRTAIEVLHENLPHAPLRPPLQLKVAYHDACTLGRGLGLYEPPRALLQRAVAEVVEGSSTRREAGCAGGGGLLPRTMPEVALEVARRQAHDLSDEGALPLVSACPTSKRMFERAGHTAYDLVGVLRRWLDSGEREVSKSVDGD
jgi:Fe-S oxidoreductase